MLSDYRVLDLTDEKGIFCGYMLAQLGAQVLAVEPPGGSALRSDNPLLWQAYARGKQSIELDMERDRERFLDLVQNADFLVESCSSSARKALGLDYKTLAGINPRLIVVSITPFGSSGPRTDWPATDLTVWAASGSLILTGDADLAPVRTSVPQAWLHAGADAAGAAH